MVMFFVIQLHFPAASKSAFLDKAVFFNTIILAFLVELLQHQILMFWLKLIISLKIHFTCQAAETVIFHWMFGNQKYQNSRLEKNQSIRMTADEKLGDGGKGHIFLLKRMLNSVWIFIVK